MQITAIIPAKGQSSFKSKNLQILKNMPLIAYSLIPATLSSLIKDIVVLTDDLEIAHVSKEYGANKVIDLPKEITKQNCGANHALLYAASKIEFDICVYLQVTDLFKNPYWIDECILNLMNSQNSSVLIGCHDHKNYWENDCPIRKNEGYYENRQTKKSWIREDSGLGCAIRKNVFKQNIDPNDMRFRLGESPKLLVKDYKFFDIHDETDLLLADRYLESLDKKYLENILGPFSSNIK